MTQIKAAVYGSVSGLMAGMLGGLVAGTLFGLSIAIFSYIGSGELSSSLLPILFGFEGLGLLVGGLIGGIAGVITPPTHKHLLRISQIIGGIMVVIPSLFFVKADTIILSFLMLSTAVMVGVVGGIVAGRFYRSIYS